MIKDSREASHHRSIWNLGWLACFWGETSKDGAGWEELTPDMDKGKRWGLQRPRLGRWMGAELPVAGGKVCTPGPSPPGCGSQHSKESICCPTCAHPTLTCGGPDCKDLILAS